MIRCLGLVAAALGASYACAQQQYTDEAVFDAAIAALGPDATLLTDAINAEVTPGNFNDPGVNEVATGARNRYVVDAADPGELRVWDGEVSGAFATSPPTYLLVTDLDSDGSTLTLEFPYPVRGFAFKTIDFGDIQNNPPGPLLATCYNGDEATGTVEFSAIAAFDGFPNSNQQFFGYIGAPGDVFSRVVLEHAGINESYGIDDVEMLVADQLERATLIARPDEPIVIDSTGSRDAAGVALWNDAGQLINFDKVSGPLGAGRISEFDGLAEGWYIAAVTPQSMQYDPGFEVRGSSSFGINATVSIAGRRFASRTVPPSGAAFFEFRVSSAADHIRPTGPVPSADIGLIAPGVITITQPVNPQWLGIFDRDTGKLLRSTNSGLTFGIGGPGRYLLIAAGEARRSPPQGSEPAGSPFGDGFHVAADASSYVINQFTLNTYTSPLAGVGDSQIKVYSFEVGLFPSFADLNGDGELNFFDVIDLVAIVEVFMP
ncbi:MAG: hypothetical protein AAFS11_03555 [Planctomycetota bacterium]